jgi:MinD-like ATPase involved in chromosome partitioning or flagellar assembly
MTANLAAAAASTGQRVAVIDTDLQSPGVHVIFGMDQKRIRRTLVDFLWNECPIEDTAYDVTDRVPGAMNGGKCWLIPASLSARAITRIIDEGYDVERLNTHLDRLMTHLELDALLIDTHPGLNRETMLSTAISDALLLLVRPDQQDYQGTAVLTEVARKLEVPRIVLVANKVFSQIDAEGLRAQLTSAFQLETIGAIPLSEDVARLESQELIIKALPNHPVTITIRRIADQLFPAAAPVQEDADASS